MINEEEQPISCIRTRYWEAMVKYVPNEDWESPNQRKRLKIEFDRNVWWRQCFENIHSHVFVSQQLGVTHTDRHQWNEFMFGSGSNIIFHEEFAVSKSHIISRLVRANTHRAEVAKILPESILTYNVTFGGKPEKIVIGPIPDEELLEISSIVNQFRDCIERSKERHMDRFVAKEREDAMDRMRSAGYRFRDGRRVGYFIPR